MSNNSDSTQGSHYLSSFLSTQLPELGLDYEAYGPYIIGCVSGTDDDELLDKDELNGVMELLQASSETHSDDEDVWKKLENEIMEKCAIQQEKQREAIERQRQELQKQEQERLQHDIELAQQQPTEPQSKKNSYIAEMDEAKRALVERFGYEQPDDAVNDNSTSCTDQQPISNKDVASQQNLERAREQRATQKTTKKQEQEATKQAKLAKSKIKEERRKRATKSERRR